MKKKIKSFNKRLYDPVSWGLSVQPVNIPTQVQLSPIPINNPNGKYNIFLFWRVYHFLDKYSTFSGLARL